MPVVSSIGGGSIRSFGFSKGLSRAIYQAGNKAAADLKSLMESMDNSLPTTGPQSGGTLSINSQSMGSYDYTIVDGPVTISSFNSNEWFTDVQDSRSALIFINGDLTINAGQVFKPSVRKLFTCIYVKGNLTVNGEISMSGRGANHSSNGSNIPAVDIKLATGTYSGIENPIIPATGGAGGLGGVDPDGSWYSSGIGNTGGTGSSGSTGGGGGGAHYLPWYSGSATRGGDGSAGTSFSGGSGGGSIACYVGPNIQALPNGDRGGYGHNYFGTWYGGAGNPSGNTINASRPTSGTLVPSGKSGTGGTLVIFATGQYSGSGIITSQGTADTSPESAATVDYNVGAGSGSGGGSITIFYGSDSGPVPDASGGIGSLGNGGTGTARKLSL